MHTHITQIKDKALAKEQSLVSVEVQLPFEQIMYALDVDPKVIEAAAKEAARQAEAAKEAARLAEAAKEAAKRSAAEKPKPVMVAAETQASGDVKASLWRVARRKAAIQVCVCFCVAYVCTCVCVCNIVMLRRVCGKLREGRRPYRCVCVCVCVCVHVCAGRYIHVHIHIHIHTTDVDLCAGSCNA
jgi:hypothetical protein